ncbi:hypothetical protein RHMOL_Rhmol08G0095100 [Rhododendron molle]|uniref:Uncharacterized protein n=1 Tax=Rhododendron molle TaxID=49168 RepID=A0ACC0MN24_RHOML|nr:hypothetical protein RHMOL_Rhmol08G0095100 [Rhododendron molle]
MPRERESRLILALKSKRDQKSTAIVDPALAVEKVRSDMRFEPSDARSMFCAVSCPKICISYPRSPVLRQRRSAPTRLRVSASLSNPSGAQVEYTPWLIVGLGNPGNKYHGTRHNVGYQMIDHSSQAEGITLNSIQSKALIGIGSIGEVPVLLAKPQAYMNFTGESVGSQLSLLILVQQENVGPLAAYYQVPLCHILLVYDEMSLPNGILRLQPKGGHGYHNGYCSPI